MKYFVTTVIGCFSFRKGLKPFFPPRLAKAQWKLLKIKKPKMVYFEASARSIAVLVAVWDLGCCVLIIKNFCFPSQKVDLIAADLTVSSKRQDVLDFSIPFMSSRLTIMTKLVCLINTNFLRRFMNTSGLLVHTNQYSHFTSIYPFLYIQSIWLFFRDSWTCHASWLILINAIYILVSISFKAPGLKS